MMLARSRETVTTKQDKTITTAGSQLGGTLAKHIAQYKTCTIYFTLQIS